MLLSATPPSPSAPQALVHLLLQEEVLAGPGAAAGPRAEGAARCGEGVQTRRLELLLAQNPEDCETDEEREDLAEEKGYSKEGLRPFRAWIASRTDTYSILAKHI